VRKTTLYLPEATRRRLQELAKRTGRRQADLMRQALDGYLALDTVPLPGSIGAGADAELSGEASEDWLRARVRPD
jgi:predicted transcriptional regulator